MFIHKLSWHCGSKFFILQKHNLTSSKRCTKDARTRWWWWCLLPERECWWAPSSPETSPWLTALPPWTLQTYLQTKNNRSRWMLQHGRTLSGLHRGIWVRPSHLGQVALGREAEAVDGVRPAVGPLAKLLRRLGERHVGGDGAVDNGLWRTKHTWLGDNVSK